MCLQPERLAGFVETNNVFDQFQVKDIFQWLYLSSGYEVQVEPSHLLEEKFSLLRKHRIYENGKVFRFYYDHYDKEIDIILRTLVASEKELQQIQENIAQGLLEKAVSLENELRVWQIITCGCKHLLQDMKTSIEEDRQLLSHSRHSSSRFQLAVQFRIEKKNILLDTISRLEHFQYASKKVGRIVTVWMPPTMKGITLQKYDI